MNALRRMRLFGTAMLVACATDVPGTDVPSDVLFDSSAGLVVVEIAGDGFVSCEGRRLPLEALVLELRQRTRRMTGDELARFVVRLHVTPQELGSEAAVRADAGFNRLINELDIMDVGQLEIR